MKDRFNFGLPFLLAEGQIFFFPRTKATAKISSWNACGRRAAAVWSLGAYLCVWTGKKQYHNVEKEKRTQPDLHLNWPWQKREDFQDELVSQRT